MPSSKFSSLLAYRLCAALILFSALFYYPKWKQPNSESTISWDVSGYYLYLPATLIYQDIKQLNWWAEIDAKYHPGPGMGQAFQHTSGNWVMKYPMGQALQFLPWFAVAHALAQPLGYPSDGFSRPYQAAISWGSLLIALLGLWFFRKVLKEYFSDQVVGLVMICLVFGSNYLEYAGITGAMPHNWLFTLYTLLLYSTLQFHRHPGLGWAATIGILIGWATITRPTEITCALIPLFWGVSSWDTLRNRLLFFKNNLFKTGVATAGAGAMIFLQLAYWKYATGDWIVYSYQDQTFSWTRPHLANVLWSAKAGWLVYSPMMLFAIIGMFSLRKYLPEIFPLVLIYCLLAVYITAAWDIWWYGGSLGQRAMVEAYPLWAFGLGAFIQWVCNPKHWRNTIQLGARGGLFFLALICIYLNLWWSHQAHRGGLFVAEQMTPAYFARVVGRMDVKSDRLKLLDEPAEFKGKRGNIRELLFENFDSDSTALSTNAFPISGTKSLILNKENQFSPEFDLPIRAGEIDWLRASCVFRCEAKETETWRMTQFVIRFRLNDKIVEEHMIRLQRQLVCNETRFIFFDTPIPDLAFDRVSVLFWNAGSEKTVRVDDLKVELFE